MSETCSKHVGNFVENPHRFKQVLSKIDLMEFGHKAVTIDANNSLLVDVKFVKST